MCIECFKKLTGEEILNIYKNRLEHGMDVESHHLEDVIITTTFICKDCGKDTGIDEKDYYMVTHQVWDEYGVGKDMLCMDCMESRIGHPLNKSDILDCPLNTMNPYTSEIMK